MNGKAVYTSYAYNSIVSYECNYGYTVVGAATRRCGADRKWTGKTPTCQEIDCGSPGVLYNGWIENIEAGESRDGKSENLHDAFINKHGVTRINIMENFAQLMDLVYGSSIFIR